MIRILVLALLISVSVVAQADDTDVFSLITFTMFNEFQWTPKLAYSTDQAPELFPELIKRYDAALERGDDSLVYFYASHIILEVNQRPNHDLEQHFRKTFSAFVHSKKDIFEKNKVIEDQSDTMNGNFSDALTDEIKNDKDWNSFGDSLVRGLQFCQESEKVQFNQVEWNPFTAAEACKNQAQSGRFHCRSGPPLNTVHENNAAKDFLRKNLSTRDGWSHLLEIYSEVLQHYSQGGLGDDDLKNILTLEIAAANNYFNTQILNEMTFDGDHNVVNRSLKKTYDTYIQDFKEELARIGAETSPNYEILDRLAERSLNWNLCAQKASDNSEYQFYKYQARDIVRNQIVLFIRGKMKEIMSDKNVSLTQKLSGLKTRVEYPAQVFPEAYIMVRHEWKIPLENQELREFLQGSARRQVRDVMDSVSSYINDVRFSDAGFVAKMQMPVLESYYRTLEKIKDEFPLSVKKIPDQMPDSLYNKINNPPETFNLQKANFQIALEDLNTFLVSDLFNLSGYQRNEGTSMIDVSYSISEQKRITDHVLLKTTCRAPNNGAPSMSSQCQFDYSTITSKK